MIRQNDVIDLYERHAEAWNQNRKADLILEKKWLTRFISLLPAGGTVLDIGCGSGQPIARHLLERDFTVVGIDSSPSLIDICRNRFPQAEWLVADMRNLSLNRRFAGLIAWDSFFHLSYEDQRSMFAIFSAHAVSGAPLMFTSGPKHGEAIGSFNGDPLYHSSLAPTEYESLLATNGFKVLHHEIEDPDCGHHTIWLAKNIDPDQ